MDTVNVVREKAVEFNTPLAILAIPSATNDVSQLHVNLMAIMNVFFSGESVAKATSYQAATI
jgi:hypothetical protein